MKERFLFLFFLVTSAIIFGSNYTQRSSLNKASINKFSKTARGITNSVLKSGEWYRFYVDTTGVFKISKGFLQQLGVKVNDVNPKDIRLFGNGGQMIPYSNDVPYPFDVTENSIKFVGEEDGVFDNEDYILFYAQGPKGYDEEKKTNINCYADKTYYYINIDSKKGKRIEPFNQPNGQPHIFINTFQDYKFHEVDEHNILLLGRRWFGDRFDIENEKTFEFDFPNLQASIPVNLKVYVASTAKSSMQISVNETLETTLSIPALPPNSTTQLANGRSYNGKVHVNSSKIAVDLNFDNQGNPSAVGYLDYISIEATRELKFSGNQFQFYNNEAISPTREIGQYEITNAAQISEVWNVTDIYNITKAINTNSDEIFSFTSTLGEEIKKYIAVTPLDYFEPKMDSRTKVENQDIKGTIFLDDNGNPQNIDYLIIVPNNMFTQAERLAEINKKQYGLNVKAVKLNEIYNEFSTGNQDIGAIRNLVKYVYDNNPLKYLCLFGDASFDYKDRIQKNTNIVPSWYSYESFNLANSFISDDFYGMMDKGEGTMATSDRLDIAIGRILADTPQRAKEMVDKIESYYVKEAFGSWRNNFVVISDDNDEMVQGRLQQTTNQIADTVKAKKPFINVIKIHSDAFEQLSSAGGDTYPDVNTEIVNAINNGALVVNYFGHGGEDGLAEERILSKPDINGLRNFCKLNCFVTVTCEFTRFDNPFRETAGEFIYWNKQAGAIGLITTTRQVYVHFGIDFNKEFGQYLFSYNDQDKFQDFEYPTMAEALRLAKTEVPAISRNPQKRLVFFIGDPAMKLAFPKPNIQLTKINDVPITQATDTLKALSHVKLSGEVRNISGTLLDKYNGTLSTTIYDKNIDRETLANDGIKSGGEPIKLDFTTLGEIIFRGQASVKNGEFNFEFIVPKDIGIPVGVGKVSFYSKSEDLSQDRAGEYLKVKIGGLNENSENDTIGPSISLFMNDKSFVFGGITNESPTLIAELEDTNGINTASGIGHDIVAILDEDETNPFILNDYYQTKINDYTRGTVNYPFRDLEPGLHTLKLKVWDVYNNSSTSQPIEFVVFDKDEELVINNVLNYPNPFVNYTEFWFNHNSSEPLNVSIQIFTVSGKLIKTLNGQTNNSLKKTSTLYKDIVWDGKDDFGEKIGKGVYIYKLTVESNQLNKKVEKVEKLVIL